MQNRSRGHESLRDRAAQQPKGVGWRKSEEDDERDARRQMRRKETSRVRAGESRRGCSRSLAFDRNREIEEGRSLTLLKLAGNSLVDDLLHVRSASATSKACPGRQRDFTCRCRALADESANLSVTDSAAMANEHSGIPSFRTRGILDRPKLKINVVFSSEANLLTLCGSPMDPPDPYSVYISSGYKSSGE
jgi:hypothetical protein